MPQTSPGAMHPPGLLHRLTPVPPSSRQSSEQQSSFSRHTSPIGRHPLTNWQIGTPVPGSAQIPEQHSWYPVQGSPAVWHSVIVGQRPSSPHTPLQQSPSVEQSSPPPRHTETTRQRIVPSTSSQLPEQHDASPLHASPAGTHVVDADAHVPPLQSLLQQSSSSTQAWPTMAQASSFVQVPAEQESPQQSAANEQGSPSPAQPPVTHTCCPSAVASHRPEQHSAEAVHSVPMPWHSPVSPTHTPSVHLPVQQSAGSVHDSPVGRQFVVASPAVPPPVPEEPSKVPASPAEPAPPSGTVPPLPSLDSEEPPHADEMPNTTTATAANCLEQVSRFIMASKINERTLAPL